MNRSPTKGILFTPEEQFTGRRPDLSHLRVFGAKAMAHIPKVKRQKWDPKSEACVLVGYATNSKGYRLYNPKTGKVFLSRDVIILSESEEKDNLKHDGVHHDIEQFDIITEEDRVAVREDAVPVENEGVIESDNESGDEIESAVGIPNATVEEPEDEPSALPPQLSQQPLSVVRRSERERKLPGKYSDFQVTYSTFPQNLDSPQNDPRCHRRRERLGSAALPSKSKESVKDRNDSKSSGWEHSVTGKCFNEKCSEGNYLQLSIPKTVSEPDTFRDAMERDDREHWIGAMKDEHQALMDNQTW